MNGDTQTGARPKKITQTQEGVKHGESNQMNVVPYCPKKVQENQGSNDPSLLPRRQGPTESSDSTSTGNNQFRNEIKAKQQMQLQQV